MTLFEAPAPEIRKTAQISECGLYRYRLTREWGSGTLLPFIMLNPSTADASIDDPTIRRCMGFAKREGAAGIVVANLYAFRATDPDELWTAKNAVGPENWVTLCALGTTAKYDGMPIICAWGVLGSIQGKDASVVALLRELVPLKCLGKTNGGHPRHPLYLRADQPLEPFP
jgi:hypothetical protein